jgi:hypothetical protein
MWQSPFFYRLRNVQLSQSFPIPERNPAEIA